ncbi:MAG: YgjV family protein [Clostridia bacterium]|jgi:hypothetical protein|nr:YgjV family protein [Clostridia bacterium]
MIDIVAQAVSIVAAGLLILSYQFKKNKMLYIFQVFGTLLFAVSFMLLGSYTAVAMNIVALVRSAFLAKGGVFSKTPCLCLILAATIVSTVFTYSNWLSILILAAMIIQTLSAWTRNGKIMRYGQFFVSSPFWIIHNSINFSLGGLFAECFVMTSIIISFIRYGKNGFEVEQKAKKR